MKCCFEFHFFIFSLPRLAPSARMGARASRKDHGAIGGGEAEDKKTLADSTSRALSTDRLSELGKVKYIAWISAIGLSTDCATLFLRDFLRPVGVKMSLKSRGLSKRELQSIGSTSPGGVHSILRPGMATWRL